MRMWMVDPALMCDKHLLGEHCELHMLVGCINRCKSIDGFIRNDLLEPSSIHQRHNLLVEEMEKRGFKHRSMLPVIRQDFSGYKFFTHKIDRDKSFRDLRARCPKCRDGVR